MNNIVTMFKDGDGGDVLNETLAVQITPVDNGHIVSYSDEEGDYVKVFEFNNRKQMMKFLEEVLGV